MKARVAAMVSRSREGGAGLNAARRAAFAVDLGAASIFGGPKPASVSFDGSISSRGRIRKV